MLCYAMLCRDIHEPVNIVVAKTCLSMSINYVINTINDATVYSVHFVQFVNGLVLVVEDDV